MSQYNKTVLTHAGLELAKRANAGQAKFGITRAVTSADDWSNKTVQDLEEVTTIPNIMQQGTITDTDEVESNNSVIGVSLCFTNKKLSTGYQIRIIGLYVKEEGQENDFLYAVTTAVTPEYMPDFNDKVLYRFNMQLYLVIGNAQSVNVVINDGTAVTHGQFDKYKSEVTASLEKIENAHKEDMSHVVKSASINGGDEILPNEAGKLELVVPDPDLSKYVSLEQLGELLKAKADVADVNKQIKAVTDLANTKANTVDVDSKIKTVTDLANTKANISDVYTKSDVDSALAADRGRLGKLEGTQTLDSPDFNSITNTGVYYITNNTPANIKNNPVSQCGVLVVSSGNGQRISQVYYPDDGSPQWCRLLNGSNWLPWYQLSTKKDVSNAVSLANKAQDTANQANTKAQSALDNKADKTTVEENLATKANQSDLDKTNAEVAKKANSEDVTSQINSKTSGTVVTAYDIASKTPTKETDSYTNKWLVDQSALSSFADQINQLKGRQEVDAPDFNTLTDTGVYMIAGHIKNAPVAAAWGTLAVFNGTNGTNTRSTQLFVRDDGAKAFMRIHGQGEQDVWSNWRQIAWTSDITDLQNTINQQNQTIQSLTSRLTNAENEISYIKSNYVEGRRFTAGQEAQAEAWENENPQRIAFIEK